MTDARAGRFDARHRARKAALQMLYQSEIGRMAIGQVIGSFWTMTQEADGDEASDTREFAERLAAETSHRLAAIDPLITAAAEHWRLSRMAVIDRAILRLAVCEFLWTPDTPRKVVINEALELAKTFSTDESVAFINGVLDGIRKELDGERPQTSSEAPSRG